MERSEARKEREKEGKQDSRASDTTDLSRNRRRSDSSIRLRAEGELDVERWTDRSDINVFAGGVVVVPYHHEVKRNA